MIKPRIIPEAAIRSFFESGINVPPQCQALRLQAAHPLSSRGEAVETMPRTVFAVLWYPQKMVRSFRDSVTHAPSRPEARQTNTTIFRPFNLINYSALKYLKCCFGFARLLSIDENQQNRNTKFWCQYSLKCQVVDNQNVQTSLVCFQLFFSSSILSGHQPQIFFYLFYVQGPGFYQLPSHASV